MALKAVILDRDGTLVDDASGRLRDGVDRLIHTLTDAGLTIFVASNESRDRSIEKLIGLPGDRFFYHERCGNKGGKGYVAAVLAAAACGKNEVVYLGDSEQDMFEASNSGIAWFNAAWSQPGFEYGLPAESPESFGSYICRYYLKEHLWYYTVDSPDELGRQVRFRALLDPDTAKEDGVTSLLKDFRGELVPNTRCNDIAKHLVAHLIASIYLEGFHLDSERLPNSNGGLKKPLWCLYPGRSGGISPVLQLFENQAARLLKMEFQCDLLVRHKPAASSHRTRIRTGSAQPITDQMNSVAVNAALSKKVAGNVVYVVDDFSTGSNAMETSRNLLLACGAGRVVGIAVGKYGPNYTAVAPASRSPFPQRGGPATVSVSELSWRQLEHRIFPEALDCFTQTW